MIKCGNKLYERCPYCGQLVCLNKWMFGNLHICLTEAEREKYGKRFGPLTEKELNDLRKDSHAAE